MKITVTPASKETKGRIIFNRSSGDSEIEQKVLRSISSANFGERIFIRHRPTIEVIIDVPNARKVIRPYYAPESTAPEVGSVKEAIIDKDEEEAAYRTMRWHAQLKALGAKLPSTIAKKFTCRCGLMFQLPGEFIGHRRVCPLLHKEDADLLQRGAVIEAQLKAKEQILLPKPKKRQEFICRCGFPFHSKSHLTKHKKLCTAQREWDEVLERAKAYVDREKRLKDESKVGKKQRKKKVKLADRIQHIPVERNTGRKKVSKRAISKKSKR